MRRQLLSSLCLNVFLSIILVRESESLLGNSKAVSPYRYVRALPFALFILIVIGLFLTNHDSSGSLYSKRTRINMSAIGFVGLGIMGEGMAARLLSEGVAGGDEATPLVIWNRTPSKCTALQEAFSGKKIIIKDSPKEVVETCCITYCMLSTPEASRAVFEGDNGVLAGVSDGKSIVDCATLSEDDMKRMHDAVVAEGG